jgi:hypothetical protein
MRREVEAQQMDGSASEFFKKKRESAISTIREETAAEAAGEESLEKRSDEELAALCRAAGVDPVARASMSREQMIAAHGEAKNRPGSVPTRASHLRRSLQLPGGIFIN